MVLEMELESKSMPEVSTPWSDRSCYTERMVLYFGSSIFFYKASIETMKKNSNKDYIHYIFYAKFEINITFEQFAQHGKAFY